MSCKPRSKNTLAARAQQLAAGAEKHLSPKASIALNGKTFTIADVLGSLGTIAQNRADVLAAQAAARTKVDAERVQAPALMAIMAAFEVFVRLSFGAAADTLVDFGLAPHKVPEPLTAEQKAVAVARRAATRKLRNTMGPKQRKNAPKGQITAELVVTQLPPSPREE